MPIVGLRLLAFALLLQSGFGDAAAISMVAIVLLVVDWQKAILRVSSFLGGRFGLHAIGEHVASRFCLIFLAGRRFDDSSVLLTIETR